MPRKKKQSVPTWTEQSIYCFYDRKNNLCWLVHPPQEQLSEENTGLTDDTLSMLYNELESWDDPAIRKFLTEDGRLGHFMMESSLRNSPESGIAFVLKPNCKDHALWDFAERPGSYLFDYKDNLCDDVKVMAALGFTLSSRNHVKFDTIVTNKKFRKKGIGTAMYRSFIENQGFFTERDRLDSISANIREDNIPSVKAAIKNGLKVTAGSVAGIKGKLGTRYFEYHRDLKSERNM